MNIARMPADSGYLDTSNKPTFRSGYISLQKCAFAIISETCDMDSRGEPFASMSTTRSPVASMAKSKNS